MLLGKGEINGKAIQQKHQIFNFCGAFHGGNLRIFANCSAYTCPTRDLTGFWGLPLRLSFGGKIFAFIGFMLYIIRCGWPSGFLWLSGWRTPPFITYRRFYFRLFTAFILLVLLSVFHNVPPHIYTLMWLAG